MTKHMVAIAGSGTDVGKTFVACRLIEDLRARGLRVVPRKPVVSGVNDDDVGSSDTDRLLSAAGLPLRARDVVSPWRFRAPLAPNAAAQLEGVALSLPAIVAACRVTTDETTTDEADVVVVETAGGVMSPLTDEATQLDLLVAVGAPVVLVVEGSYLGWISHTLTALLALQQAGLRVVCVVVNHGVGAPLLPFVSVPVRTVDEREAILELVLR
jgi:dethiobiotin synthetase